MPETANAAAQWLADNESVLLERLMDWLRMPSVGTDPQYREQTRQAAQWASDHLEASGLTSELLPTGTEDEPGHPIVLASTPGDPSYTGPHILFYGHYDVQPADPIELWETGPFDPVLKPAEGDTPARIVARGASDDKGQVATFLEALRSWKETGGPVAGGVKLTVLLEGEEESGSVNLENFVEQYKDRLGEADVCLISDTGMLAPDKPAITYGVRGLTYTEVILHGPDQDLHSGMWGGKVPNPNNELARILGQLWDQDRRITIPGFYDDVRPLGDDERAEWRELYDAEASLKKIGLGPEADIGEAGYSAIEREWARPTAEINGIVGGYTGAGAKTVIPSHASAKVSFRLVADQEPEKIRDAFFAWLQDRTPPGCRWELLDHGGGSPGTCATDSKPLKLAREALRQAWDGADAALIKSGGSIPVAGLLKETLGMETIFMGFGLDDDRVHSPNEKFDVECFRKGARAHALLLGLLADS